MNAFVYVATIVFALLALIWNKSNWLNFLIRAVFFFMTFWGIVQSLQALGYMVKL